MHLKTPSPKNKPHKIRKWLFVSVLSFLILISLFEFIVWLTDTQNVIYEAPHKTRVESFDSSLARINSVEKLELYMDSALKAAPDTFFSAAAKYPEVLTDFIRSRFYHGLYQYRPGNNYLAWIGTRLLKRSVNEIWRADDILKSTYCYCGQQCLVMMEMLMKKGYKVRKVTLHSDKFKAGHFVFETYFDNAWHMYDPDEEPDLHSLRALKRPDVATIAADTAMLSQIYTDNSLMMRDLFQHPNTGKENELMPEKIYLFQWVTKYVSIFSWIPLLGILLFYLRKSRRKKMALQTGKNHPNSTGK